MLLVVREKKLKLMDTETFLAHNQIFTIEESRIALEIGRTGSTFHNLLTYYLQRGHIVRVRKGLYYSIPKGVDPITYPIDPYLVAGKMAPDAILAYHTSLGFHGNLHSLRNNFTYITQRKLKSPFAFRNLLFEGVSIPKGTSHDVHFGVEIVDYQGCKIRETILERTFVDILDRPALINSWE